MTCWDMPAQFTMIDYSQLAFPKGKPKALAKREQASAIEAKDKTENAKAKARANGRCEVIVGDVRCRNRDSQTHHLLGGIGRRNKGNSILAEYKIRVCDDCHSLLTGNILQATTAEHTAATVRYRRAR
jgi:hypothetical protein